MKITVSKIIRTVTYGLFGILVFFYFLRQVDPALIHFRQQPMFLTGVPFFISYLLTPGGIAEYLALFFMQFFLFPVPGSLLLAGFIVLAVILSRRVLSCFFPGGKTGYLEFVPGLVLIYLHSRYDFGLQTVIGLLAALAAVLLFTRLNPNRPGWKRMLLVPANALLLFFFGGLPLILFALLYVLWELTVVRQPSSRMSILLQVLMGLVLVAGVPLISQQVKDVGDLMGLQNPGRTGSFNTLILFLMFSLPGIVMIGSILNFAARRLAISNGEGNKSRAMITRVLAWALPVLVLGASLLVFGLAREPGAGDSIRIHKLASEGEWRSVIRLARKLPHTDRKVLFQLNRALYHLGLLNDEAFHFNQYWGEHGLILTTYYNREVLMLCSDLYFDMGHVKESLHWAYEAYTKSERTPDILRRIVLGNLIIGNYQAADIYLNVLEQSLLHKRWARHYKAMIRTGADLEADAVIREKRSLLPRADFFVNTQHPQYDLHRIYTENPQNKMAYEYMMLYAMLQQDLITIATHLDGLESLNYDRIPVHLEEAILLFMALNQTYQVDLGKYRISETTTKRFLEFSKAMMRYGRNKQAAKAGLWNEYGNTFWYYLNFLSPKATHRTIKEK